MSLTVPQNLVGNEGHPKVPDGEKLVSSVTRVRTWHTAGGGGNLPPPSHLQHTFWVTHSQ